MGFPLFSSSSINSVRVENLTLSNKIRELTNYNPDPRYYKITHYEYINKFLILNIVYPNCKNYEGTKILVFYEVTMEQLTQQKLIDPHFSDDLSFYSPIARFTPTELGMEMARSFCSNFF